MAALGGSLGHGPRRHPGGRFDLTIPWSTLHYKVSRDCRAQRLGLPKLEGGMRWNVLLKALIVGVLALAFVVPLVMIWGVVKDRARYRDAITAEVAASTAGSQTLVGPLIVVRYRERIPPAVKGGVEQVREGTEILLPDSLAVRSNAQVETRQRGIHRVPVFRSANEITAEFTV